MMPAIYILVLMFRDGQSTEEGEDGTENAVGNFADWMLHNYSRSGWFSVILSFFIHLNIYIFLFLLSCMAMRMKSLVERKGTLTNTVGGTYNATELHLTMLPKVE